MANSKWKEVYSSSAKNANIAASGVENIKSSEADIRKYGQFNRLNVDNSLDGGQDIEVRLDGLTTTGKLFRVTKGIVFGIEPEDGILFSFVQIVNLSSANQHDADKTLIRWAKAEEV